MKKKIVEIAKKIGNVLWNFAKFVAKKFWSFLKLIGIVIKWIVKRIKKLINKIKTRKKPGIFVLIKRFFQGFGVGIYAGIKDAISSWKYDRGKTTDYIIEIQRLSFHDRG